jgi:hypothetical protein
MQERAGRPGKLSIKQKYEKDTRVGRSYRYEFWHVQGVDHNGKRIRKKFSDEQKAKSWMAAKGIELTNQGRKMAGSAASIRSLRASITICSTSMSQTLKEASQRQAWTSAGL